MSLLHCYISIFDKEYQLDKMRIIPTAKFTLERIKEVMVGLLILLDFLNVFPQL